MVIIDPVSPRDSGIFYSEPVNQEGGDGFTMRKEFNRLIVAIFCSFLGLILLVSCGGGDSSSGGSNSTGASPPVANAGPSQNWPIGTIVTLDGSASWGANGVALTYAWTLTSKPTGSAAYLTAPNSAKPTLTCDMVGDYVLTLIVNDGKMNSEPATVIITIREQYSGPPPRAPYFYWWSFLYQ